MANKEIREYRLIASSTPDMLNGRVCSHLDVGWELYGGPSIASDGSGCKTYIQAVVK
jgi:hypothetical protein